MSKLKRLATILVVLAMLASFAACGEKNGKEGEGIPETSVATEEKDKPKEEEAHKTFGIVKEISLTDLKLVLEDGKEVSLKVEGIEGISDVALGDTIEVGYTEGEDQTLTLKTVKVTKKSEKKAEETTSVAEDPEKQSTESNNQSSQTSLNQTSTQQKPVAEKNPEKEEPKKAPSPANEPSSKPDKKPVEEQLSAQEKAKRVVATGDIDILDQNKPAVNVFAMLSTMTFSDKNDEIIAFVNKEFDVKTFERYYGHYPAVVGYVKLFNDYRGLPTGVAIAGNSQYEYDKSTDTFIFKKDLSPDATPESKPQEKPNKPDTEEKPSQTSPSSLNNLVDLVNEYRTDNGLGELTIDNSIMEFASIRAEEIYTNYSHERPDGSRPSQLGYWEIITKTHTDEESALRSWKNSSAHNDILLEPSITKVGAGEYKGHWVMLFID